MDNSNDIGLDLGRLIAQAFGLPESLIATTESVGRSAREVEAKQHYYQRLLELADNESEKSTNYFKIGQKRNG